VAGDAVESTPVAEASTEIAVANESAVRKGADGVKSTPAGSAGG
jgi:hypothetical protein